MFANVYCVLLLGDSRSYCLLVRIKNTLKNSSKLTLVTLCNSNEISDSSVQYEPTIHMFDTPDTDAVLNWKNCAVGGVLTWLSCQLVGHCR